MDTVNQQIELVSDPLPRTLSRLSRVETCCSRVNFSRASPKAVCEDKYVVTERRSRSNRIAPSCHRLSETFQKLKDEKYLGVL